MKQPRASAKPRTSKPSSRAPEQRVGAGREPEIALPPTRDWRTTGEDEINRRRLRAREGSFIVRNTDARLPVFSNFSVGSGSGLTHAVERQAVAHRSA